MKQGGLEGNVPVHESPGLVAFGGVGEMAIIGVIGQKEQNRRGFIIKGMIILGMFPSALLSINLVVNQLP